MVKKAVCLVSGGIDSCVTVYLAKNENFEIYVLTINYGQRHKKEIECAKSISSTIGAKDHIIIGDMWYFASKKEIVVPLHPDIPWLGINHWSDKYVYSFDIFVNPDERGNNVPANFQNNSITKRFS